MVQFVVGAFGGRRESDWGIRLICNAQGCSDTSVARQRALVAHASVTSSLLFLPWTTFRY